MESNEPVACCQPTEEELALLKAGDCTPEELWGGSRPTCPKCLAQPVAVDGMPPKIPVDDDCFDEYCRGRNDMHDTVSPLVAKLRAENADYKAGQERYEDLCDQNRAEIRALRAANNELVSLLRSLRRQNYFALDVEQCIDAILKSAGGDKNAIW